MIESKFLLGSEFHVLHTIWPWVEDQLAFSHLHPVIPTELQPLHRFQEGALRCPEIATVLQLGPHACAPPLFFSLSYKRRVSVSAPQPASGTNTRYFRRERAIRDAVPGM